MKISIYTLIALSGLLLTTLSPAQAQSPNNGTKPLKIEDIDPAMKGKKAEEGIRWIDCKTLTVEGKGFDDTESFYDRLPVRAKETVERKVWNLSQHSAGFAVRFTTSAESISARWTLRDSALAMVHMPAIGKSGLDLYIKRDGKWHWAGVGKPEQFPVSEALLVRLPVEARNSTNEFLLYLPLYNGVEKVEIGVPHNATVAAAVPRGKPIIFYGTSILHGGCASRPGMAFPAILGRWFDCPVINLGFSGSGQMQPEVVPFLAEIDAAAYVIDCIPNMVGMLGKIVDRTIDAVSLLRKTHPGTPVILVEGSPWAINFAFDSFASSKRAKANAELKTAYEMLLQEDPQHLYYIKGDLLLGTDGEATVDGTHPSDLGMMRNAEALLPHLQQILNRMKK